MITNRDTGDETTYEQCEVMIPGWEVWKQCVRQKGHKGIHSIFYTTAYRETHPILLISNELIKDEKD